MMDMSIVTSVSSDVPHPSDPRKLWLHHSIPTLLYLSHTGYSSCLAGIHETVHIISCIIDSAFYNPQCINVMFLSNIVHAIISRITILVSVSIFRVYYLPGDVCM